MSTEAVIMLAVAATLLWGGLVLAIVHYVRADRTERPDEPAA